MYNFFRLREPFFISRSSFLMNHFLHPAGASFDNQNAFRKIQPVILNNAALFKD